MQNMISSHYNWKLAFQQLETCFLSIFGRENQRPTILIMQPTMQLLPASYPMRQRHQSILRQGQHMLINSLSFVFDIRHALLHLRATKHYEKTLR